MPFGLSGAAGSFQASHGQSIDDVLIYSGTKDDHVKHLTAVFQRLKDAGLC